MVGDRGGVLDTTLGDAGRLVRPGAVPVQTPTARRSSPTPVFAPGTYDRRVDLTKEVAGSVGGPFRGAAATLSLRTASPSAATTRCAAGRITTRCTAAPATT